MTLGEYQQQVRTLSDRLIELQRPIRILDAIKWPSKAKAEFFAGKCSSLPDVQRSWYESINPGFDRVFLRDRLVERGGEVQRGLGRDDVLGSILCPAFVQ